MRNVLKSLAWCAILGAVFMMMPAAARADLNGSVGPAGDDPPYTLGSGWAYFSWSGGPGVFNNEGPFTFSSSIDVILDVTDAFLSGDRFEVYDFGALVLTTSGSTDGDQIWDDYDAAFADPRWSSGSVLLGAGAHSIAFKTIAVPTGNPGGGAAFRADVVPAPGSVVLGWLGVACLGIVRRRSR